MWFSPWYSFDQQPVAMFFPTQQPMYDRRRRNEEHQQRMRRQRPWTQHSYSADPGLFDFDDFFGTAASGQPQAALYNAPTYGRYAPARHVSSDQDITSDEDADMKQQHQQQQRHHYRRQHMPQHLHRKRQNQHHATDVPQTSPRGAWKQQSSVPMQATQPSTRQQPFHDVPSPVASPEYIQEKPVEDLESSNKDANMQPSADELSDSECTSAADLANLFTGDDTQDQEMQEQPEKAPEVAESVQNLAAIRQKVDNELLPRLIAMQNASQIPEKEYLYVYHMLEREEDAVDKIDSFGMQEIRKHRKATGDYIRGLIAQTELLRSKIVHN